MNRQLVLRGAVVALLVILAVVGLIPLLVGLTTNDYSRFTGSGGWLGVVLIIGIELLNVACWIVLPALSAYLTVRAWPGVRIVVSVMAVLYLATAIGGDLLNLLTLAAGLGALVLVWLPVTGLGGSYPKRGVG